MNCVINNSIVDNIKKGRQLEVIRRYIQMKYRTSMDMRALKERVKLLNLKLDF
jgi:hypothetical protein